MSTSSPTSPPHLIRREEKREIDQARRRPDLPWLRIFAAMEVIANDHGNLTTPPCVPFTNSRWIIGDASMKPINNLRWCASCLWLTHSGFSVCTNCNRIQYMRLQVVFILRDWFLYFDLVILFSPEDLQWILERNCSRKGKLARCRHHHHNHYCARSVPPCIPRCGRQWAQGELQRPGSQEGIPHLDVGWYGFVRHKPLL